MKKQTENKEYCERMHADDFFMGILWFIVDLLLIVPLVLFFMVFIQISNVFYTSYLKMKGEPLMDYSPFDQNHWFKDRKLRYKKWKKESKQE